MRYIFTLVLFTLLILCEACSSSSQQNEKDQLMASSEGVKQTKVFQPSWVRNAVFHNIDLRHFSAQKNIEGLANKLDSFSKSKISTLWLHPFFPYIPPSQKLEKYPITNHLSIDTSLGTVQDFQELVSLAHEKEVRILLEWIPDYTSAQHVWVDAHPEFYKAVDEESIALLDYKNEALRKAMLKAMSFWINHVGVDGFVCRYESDVPSDFWAQSFEALRKIKPDIFMVDYGKNSGPIKESGFNATLSHSFKWMIDTLAYSKKATAVLDNWYYHNAYHSGFNVHLLGEDHTLKNHLYEILAFTIEGSIVLPIDGLGSSVHKTLIDLKRENPALANGKDGGVFKRLNTNNDMVYGFYRTKEKNKVIVILNLDDQPQDITIEDKACVGQFSNVFGNSTISITENMMMHLKAWDYIILQSSGEY